MLDIAATHGLGVAHCREEVGW